MGDVEKSREMSPVDCGPLSEMMCGNLRFETQWVQKASAQEAALVDVKGTRGYGCGPERKGINNVHMNVGKTVVKEWAWVEIFAFWQGIQFID